ncbi:MAG: hypothetical protein K6G18_10580 [Treponema sp.]|nr:hypothetical protein [Treponema sp.]
MANELVQKPVFFFLLLLLSLSSCSKKAESGRKRSFLKDRARIMEGRTEWSDDVSTSGDVLLPSESMAPDLVELPLAHIMTFQSRGGGRNYPYLDGFASLDTGAYSDASMSALDGFCRALEAGRGEESFMDKGFLYSLALFKYTLGQRTGGKGTVKVLSHVIGMPLFPEGKSDSLQCPVRLSLSDGSLCDIYVYLVKSAADWKVNQIDFMKKTVEDGA